MYTSSFDAREDLVIGERDKLNKAAFVSLTLLYFVSEGAYG